MAEEESDEPLLPSVTAESSILREAECEVGTRKRRRIRKRIMNEYEKTHTLQFLKI